MNITENNNNNLNYNNSQNQTISYNNTGTQNLQNKWDQLNSNYVSKDVLLVKCKATFEELIDEINSLT